MHATTVTRRRCLLGPLRGARLMAEWDELVTILVDRHDDEDSADLLQTALRNQEELLARRGGRPLCRDDPCNAAAGRAHEPLRRQIFTIVARSCFPYGKNFPQFLSS